jgi:hypothetical protein
MGGAALEGAETSVSIIPTNPTNVRMVVETLGYRIKFLAVRETAGFRPMDSHSGAKAINPRGMGTESPSEEALFLYAVAAALVRQLRGPHLST